MACGAALNHVIVWNTTKNSVIALSASIHGLALRSKNRWYSRSP